MASQEEDSERQDVSSRLDRLSGDCERTVSPTESLNFDDNQEIGEEIQRDETETVQNKDDYYELIDGLIPNVCSSGLKISHININSLPNKVDELSLLLGNDPFDIVAVSETHCDSTIPDTDVCIDNFTVIRKDRSRHGGGVALYIRNSLSFSQINYNLNEVEGLWIKIKQKREDPLLLGVIYRPPNSPNDFFETLTEMLHCISENEGEIILVGDFNCDLLPKNLNPESRNLLSVMDTNLLHQLIDVPTRVTPNSKSLIDHVYSSNPEEHQLTGVFETHISDHYMTFTVYGNTKVETKHLENVIEYRCYRKFSEGNFINMLKNLPFLDVMEDTNPNNALKTWYDLYMTAVNEHAPLKRKRLRSKLCPWVTGDLIDTMNKRDWYFKMSKKASNPQNSHFWLMYKSLRNEISTKIKEAKNYYINALLHENGGTPNAMWKTLKLISSSKKDSQIKLELNGEEVCDAEEIAHQFNDYFVNSVDSLFNPINFDFCESSGDIDQSENREAVGNVPPDISFDLPVVSDEFVINEIHRMPVKKATGPDDVSIKLLKHACNAPNVIQSLTHILNLSLDQGEFLDNWKIARVQPIYKAGNKLSVENYRPVSLLSIPSKLLEKAVNISFQEYLIENKILSDRQFGFRANHSCETASLCMVDQWSQNVDHGYVNGVAFIDMRKAFDAVNHTILLLKLKIVGCTDRSLRWFTSYLKGRSQFVSIKGKRSSTRAIHYGVPQGSVLAPLLFSLFINDLPRSIQNGEMFLFADDATLSVRGRSMNEIQTKLNQALDEVYTWTQKNKLLLNTNKTKVMVVGSRQKLQTLNSTRLQIQIKSTPIERVSRYKCLGIVIDDNLQFTKHVDKVALQMKQKLGILRRLKGTFNTHYLSLLYWGYILPHALYCCNVWANRSQQNYDVINKLHKRAAYIIAGCSWETPSEQVLTQLNWPTLQKLYSKAMACMTFKCVHHLAPSLLSVKFVLHDDVAQRITRNSHQLKLEPPRCNTEFYRRSFVCSAVSYWNNLPIETRCSPNLESFKSKL